MSLWWAYEVARPLSAAEMERLGLNGVGALQRHRRAFPPIPVGERLFFFGAARYVVEQRGVGTVQILDAAQLNERGISADGDWHR